FQIGMKLGAAGGLNAMVGPEHLRSISNSRGLERLLARVRRGKRVMSGRMPILRQHHVLETAGQMIDQRHDLVAARHRQPAARAEIVLHVDHHKDVAVSGLDPFRHGCAFSYCAICPSTSAASRTRASLTSTGYDGPLSSTRKDSGSCSNPRATRARISASV